MRKSFLNLLNNLAIKALSAAGGVRRGEQTGGQGEAAVHVTTSEQGSDLSSSAC